MGVDRQQGQSQRAGDTGQDARQQAGQQTDEMRGYATSVEELTRDWPEPSKKAAMKMRQQYGQPDGMTPSRIIWENKGQWKEIIVYKEPVQHDFPMPHKDVLEQVVNYDVPADKFTDLARFDGSVIAEGTKGTLAARCDKEPANILALNLAHDIIRDKKSVEEARQAYAGAIKQVKAGENPAITQQLQFTPPEETGDPGVAVIGAPEREARPAGDRQSPQQQQHKSSERQQGERQDQQR